MGMKLAIVMGAILMSLGIVFSWYYKDTQKRMDDLRENAAILEVSVQANERALEFAQESAEQSARLNRELQGKLQDSEQYGDRLRVLLSKHDLTMLALTKPKLIENRMNDATQKLLDAITADTTD